MESFDDSGGVERIGIKLKTLDNQTFDLNSVKKDISIRRLKELVKETTTVPEDRQRLIYRGKVLRDADLLSKYQVEDGHTVHMVARPAEAPSGDIIEPRRTNDNEASISSSPVDDDDTDPSSLAFEGIWQGLMTAETLWSVGTGYTDSASNFGSLNVGSDKSEAERQRTVGADASRRRRKPFFHLGQWVDVKDTVNQWLEATILETSGSKVLVHYNGWPSRWDEWIDSGSARIAPFRSHTTPRSALCPTLNQRDVYRLIFPGCADEMLLEIKLAIERVIPEMEMIGNESRKRRISDRRRRTLEEETKDHAGEDDAWREADNIGNKESVRSGEGHLSSEEGAGLGERHEGLKTNDTNAEDVPESWTERPHGSATQKPEGPLMLSDTEMYTRACELAAILDRLGRVITDFAPYISSWLYMRPPTVEAAQERALAASPANAHQSQDGENSSVVSAMDSALPSNEVDSIHHESAATIQTEAATEESHASESTGVQRRVASASDEKSAKERENTAGHLDYAENSQLAPTESASEDDIVGRGSVASHSSSDEFDAADREGYRMLMRRPERTGNNIDIHIHAIVTPFTNSSRRGATPDGSRSRRRRRRGSSNADPNTSPGSNRQLQALAEGRSLAAAVAQLSDPADLRSMLFDEEIAENGENEEVEGGNQATTGRDSEPQDSRADAANPPEGGSSGDTNAPIATSNPSAARSEAANGQQERGVGQLMSWLRRTFSRTNPSRRNSGTGGGQDQALPSGSSSSGQRTGDPNQTSIAEGADFFFSGD